MNIIDRVNRAVAEGVEALEADPRQWRDLIAALRGHPTGYRCFDKQPPGQAMVYGVTVKLVDGACTLKLTDSTGRTVVLEGEVALDLPEGGEPVALSHDRLRHIELPPILVDAERVLGAALPSVTTAPTKPNRAQRRAQRRRKP